jgi:hypothetical protein
VSFARRARQAESPQRHPEVLNCQTPKELRDAVGSVRTRQERGEREGLLISEYQARAPSKLSGATAETRFVSASLGLGFSWLWTGLKTPALARRKHRRDFSTLPDPTCASSPAHPRQSRTGVWADPQIHAFAFGTILLFPWPTLSITRP